MAMDEEERNQPWHVIANMTRPHSRDMMLTASKTQRDATSGATMGERSGEDGLFAQAQIAPLTGLAESLESIVMHGFRPLRNRFQRHCD